MSKTRIKLKCAVCGHRTLNTYDPSRIGNGVKLSAVAYLCSGEGKREHIKREPAGEPGPVRHGFTVEEIGYDTFDDRATAKLLDRVTIVCHPKCGASHTVRIERLWKALVYARAYSRDTVWLPTDLKAVS